MFRDVPLHVFVLNIHGHFNHVIMIVSLRGLFFCFGIKDILSST